MRRLPALIVAIALVSACSAAPKPGGLTIPTDDVPRDGFPSALISGVVRANQSGGNACFWIESEGVDWALLWPKGYTGQANPLRVLNDAGEVVATDGAGTSLAGGEAPTDSQVKECPGIEHHWLVAPQR